jgi:hypothetical protein
MALNYGKLVPDADQIVVLEQRLAARAMEAWQHSLNLEDATTAGNAEVIASSTGALAILDAAIIADRKRLNKLGRNLPLV